MAKKNITIDDLAVMVQKGFEETAKKSDMDVEFERVDKRFEQVDKRLDKIEKLLIAEDRRRIDKLESRVDYLENILAVANKK